MTVVARGLAVTSEGFRARERENEEPLRFESRRARLSVARGGVTIPVYLHMREKKAARTSNNTTLSSVLPQFQ